MLIERRMPADLSDVEKEIFRLDILENEHIVPRGFPKTLGLSQRNYQERLDHQTNIRL